MSSQLIAGSFQQRLSTVDVFLDIETSKVLGKPAQSENAGAGSPFGDGEGLPGAGAGTGNPAGNGSNNGFPGAGPGNSPMGDPGNAGNAGFPGADPEGNGAFPDASPMGDPGANPGAFPGIM